MPVLREWRAEIRRDLKDEYVRYVKETGLAAYLATPGNLGASVAVRDLDERRSEIVTLSWWTDLQAVRHLPGRRLGGHAISRRMTGFSSRGPNTSTTTKRPSRALNEERPT